MRSWQAVQWQRETSSTLPLFFILQGHPASFTWTSPTSVSLFLLLNFPFLQVSFLWCSVFGCEVCTPFPLFYSFLLCANWIRLLGLISNALSRPFFSLGPIPTYPFLFAFPFFANATPCHFHPPSLILTSTPPPFLSPSALPIAFCHFPGKGALCFSCLSISALGTQFWAVGPVCAEGKLCLSKRVPTPAPGTTKEAFFARQWLSLTPGPRPLEGMSGFPRWHTETAIRGRKPGAGASWESCQGRGGWDKEGMRQCFVFETHCCAYTYTNSQKDTFILLHAQIGACMYVAGFSYCWLFKFSANILGISC